MFRLFTAAIALALITISAATVYAAGKTHEGTVVTAGSGKLVMTGTDGKEHSHSIDNSAKITVNGKSGKLEDLKSGMRIQVMTDDQDKVVSVMTVDMKK